MLLEVPLEAAAARAADSPVWFAVAFDRACRVRRRGVRWGSRAGWFASSISACAALFACLRGCLLAIVFILWIRIALRDACTATSPALGARRAATQEGAVDTDSNASRVGEVERKVWRGNDFLLSGKVLKSRRPLTTNPRTQPPPPGRRQQDAEVGAVEVQNGGAGPGRIGLNQVSDYSADSLHPFIAANLAPGALPGRPFTLECGTQFTPCRARPYPSARRRRCRNRRPG